MKTIRIASFIVCLAIVNLLGPAAAAQTAPAAKPQTPAKPPAAKPVQPPADSDDEVEIPAAVPGALFPPVIARVNGRPILGRDAEMSIRAQLAPIGNPEWKNLKADYQQELIGQAVGSLVASELVYQKAVASGMKATDAEVQAEFSKAMKSLGSDGEFNAALASRGLDRQTYMKELSRSLTVEHFIRETVGKKITVTPAEVAQYYNEHKNDFSHPELVRTSHILFVVPEGASAEQDRVAEQRAQAILARVKKNEDFAKLAKENSMDESASKGGDLGLVSKGNLDPEYEKVAFSLPVGGVSDPVRTRAGYHIIKVTDKKKEGIADIEDVRESLTEYLRNEKTNAEVQKMVEGLKTAAKIEILIAAQPSDTPAKPKVSSPRP